MEQHKLTIDDCRVGDDIEALAGCGVCRFNAGKCIAFIERRAYDALKVQNEALSHLNDQLVISADALKAERDALKKDIENLVESDVAAAKFMANQGDRISELERENNQLRLNCGNVENLADQQSMRISELERELAEKTAAAPKAKPFQVATIGPNSPQEIYGEVKAAPKAEPYRYCDDFKTTSRYEIEALTGLETISAQIHESNKLLAELTKARAND